MLSSGDALVNLGFAFSLGALTAAAIIPILIQVQRRSRLGQEIYADGPRSHAVKRGTPTIGGLAFLAAAALALAVKFAPSSVPLLLLVLCAGIIGLVDDTLILRKRRALGLRARTKFALLALAAVAYVTWISQTQLGHQDQAWFGSSLHLPQWLWFLLAVLAINGAAHAVNLTDGLDGLAAGSMVAPLLFVAYVTYSAIAAAVCGACAGFLWYNRHPARIFMGDTGSLALGTLLAGVAVQNSLLLLLPLIGGVFVIETLSVMAQVVSFKSTGRRIFKMSPLHHHFELSGWQEQRVTLAFVVVSFAASCATWIGLLMTNARGQLL